MESQKEVEVVELTLFIFSCMEKNHKFEGLTL